MAEARKVMKPPEPVEQTVDAGTMSVSDAAGAAYLPAE